MTFLILILSVLALALVVDAVLLALHDGRGPQRPPASHFDDPQFRTPLVG